MLNRVILMGRLVSDPELKTTPNGVSVTNFRIAVDRSYVRSGEERKADFIDIVCCRQQAEFVCRYFGKGAMIAIEGQDGTNRYVVEVVADNVSFTGEKRDNSGYGNQSYGNQYSQPQQYSQPRQYQEPAPQAAPSYESGSNADFQDMPLDDDLPF